MNTTPKKDLGQHWLTDDSILLAIVEAGEVTSGDTILEIGPGKGTLTEKLADTGATVIALEFDKDLLPILEKKFKNCNNVAINYGDIRTFNYSDLPSGFKVIANIPYYLTSHLVRSLSESENPPSSAVLLVQKEVAQRLCAQPGDMSILAVTAQYYFDCTLDIEVPAEYFTPPPKVDSQVVVLRRRTSPLFDADTKSYFRLVKAGFSEKRKTLRNSLSGGLAINKDEVESLLAKASIKPNARAQELSLQDWYTLYIAYESSASSPKPTQQI